MILSLIQGSVKTLIECPLSTGQSNIMKPLFRGYDTVYNNDTQVSIMLTDESQVHEYPYLDNYVVEADSLRNLVWQHYCDNLQKMLPLEAIDLWQLLPEVYLKKLSYPSIAENCFVRNWITNGSLHS